VNARLAGAETARIFLAPVGGASKPAVMVDRAEIGHSPVGSAVSERPAEAAESRAQWDRA
jgi:hypothetical protein